MFDVKEGELKCKLRVLVRCWLKWGWGGAAGLSLSDVLVGVMCMVHIILCLLLGKSLTQSWQLNVTVLCDLIMIFTF